MTGSRSFWDHLSIAYCFNCQLRAMGRQNKRQRTTSAPAPAQPQQHQPQPQMVMPGFGMPHMPQFMMQSQYAPPPPQPIAPQQEADESDNNDSSTDSQDAKITTSASMMKGLPRVWLSTVEPIHLRAEPDGPSCLDLDLVHGQARCQDLRAPCLANDCNACLTSRSNHFIFCC